MKKTNKICPQGHMRGLSPLDRIAYLSLVEDSNKAGAGEMERKGLLGVTIKTVSQGDLMNDKIHLPWFEPLSIRHMAGTI